MTTQTNSQLPTNSSEIVWEPAQPGTVWNTEPVKKSAGEAIDAVIPKAAACVAVGLRMSVATSVPVVFDYAVKPIVTSCLGTELPEGSKPFMDLFTGTTAVETLGPTIDACVKSTSQYAQYALKESSNSCIDGAASCVQRIVASSW